MVWKSQWKKNSEEKWRSCAPRSIRPVPPEQRVATLPGKPFETDTLQISWNFVSDLCGSPTNSTKDEHEPLLCMWYSNGDASQGVFLVKGFCSLSQFVLILFLVFSQSLLWSCVSQCFWLQTLSLSGRRNLHWDWNCCAGTGYRWVQFENPWLALTSCVEPTNSQQGTDTQAFEGCNKRNNKLLQNHCLRFFLVYQKWTLAALQGPDIQEQHCIIANVENDVTLHPHKNAGVNINNRDVTRPVKLTQGRHILLVLPLVLRWNLLTLFRIQTHESSAFAFAALQRQTCGPFISEFSGRAWRSRDALWSHVCVVIVGDPRGGQPRGVWHYVVTYDSITW